jgi:hypothetical protein
MTREARGLGRETRAPNHSDLRYALGMKTVGWFGVVGGVLVASALTACGPDADGSTEDQAPGATPAASDSAKPAPAVPAPTLKPQKLKGHVD